MQRIRAFITMWVCKKCGNKNRPDKLVCERCGQPDPTMTRTK